MIEVRELGKYNGTRCVHITTHGCAVSTGFVDLHPDDALYVLNKLAEIFNMRITPRSLTSP